MFGCLSDTSFMELSLFSHTTLDHLLSESRFMLSSLKKKNSHAHTHKMTKSTSNSKELMATWGMAHFINENIGNKEIPYWEETTPQYCCSFVQCSGILKYFSFDSLSKTSFSVWMPLTLTFLPKQRPVFPWPSSPVSSPIANPTGRNKKKAFSFSCSSHVPYVLLVNII